MKGLHGPGDWPGGAAPTPIHGPACHSGDKGHPVTSLLSPGYGRELRAGLGCRWDLCHTWVCGELTAQGSAILLTRLLRYWKNKPTRCSLGRCWGCPTPHEAAHPGGCTTSASFYTLALCLKKCPFLQRDCHPPAMSRDTDQRRSRVLGSLRKTVQGRAVPQGIHPRIGQDFCLQSCFWNGVGKTPSSACIQILLK